MEPEPELELEALEQQPTEPLREDVAVASSIEEEEEEAEEEEDDDDGEFHEVLHPCHWNLEVRNASDHHSFAS